MSELNDKSLVEVYNNGTGVVFYYSDLNKSKRKWETPNAMKKISVEELKDLVMSAGGYELLTEDLLIKDIDARIALELPTNPEFLLDDLKIKELLKKNVTSIKAVLSKTTETIKEKIAMAAIEAKITDTDKMEVIQELTGVDVLSAIKEKKEEEKIKK